MAIILWRKLIRFSFPLLVLITLVLTACAPNERILLPDSVVVQENVAGIESQRIRIWGDATRSEFSASLAANSERIKKFEETNNSNLENYLVLSGGGQNGAFGAGLLNGWTKSGTRPEFKIVTGVSTGALIAPFAFLGSRYDNYLKEFYTTHSTKDILKIKLASGLLGGKSFADSKPLAGLIAKYITPKILLEIATEHQKGRLLLVGTTNLDAGRPVIWNMGEIAQIGDARALKLFRSIILASASIPGVFPPVMIDVSADGNSGQEMHVDGGATDNAILLPFHINLNEFNKNKDLEPTRKLYVVINSTLHPSRKSVKAGTFNIASRSIQTLIKRITIGDTQRLYEFSKRNEIEFNIAGIPTDFKAEHKELFDRAFMGTLFTHAYNSAINGYKWQQKPPGT